MEQILDVRQALEILGISEPSLYRLVRPGEVTVAKLAGRTLFPPADLEALVERHLRGREQAQGLE
jgi:predicted DNA-binding transcriptional regulator AlpA